MAQTTSKRSAERPLFSRRQSKILEALTQNFAEQLRKNFAQEITCDPKALRTAVVRFLRRALPLRRGRPNDPRIDAAVRMRDQGRSVKEILRLQIPGFDQRDAYERYLAEKGLRTAITRRHKLTRATTLTDNAV